MSSNSDRVKEWRHRTKDRLLKAFGNKCGICGYNKCKSGLEFHHLDPSQKEFALSHRNSKGKGWALIVTEMKKCVLLCSLCHREVHEGVTDLPDNIVRFDEGMASYNESDVENNCPTCLMLKPASKSYCSDSCRSTALSTVKWHEYNLVELVKSMTVTQIAGMIGCSVSAVSRRMKIQSIRQ